MYCKNCGKELPENAVFCAKCGCRINSVKSNHKIFKHIPAIIAIFLILLSIGAFLSDDILPGILILFLGIAVIVVTIFLQKKKNMVQSNATQEVASAPASTLTPHYGSDVTPTQQVTSKKITVDMLKCKCGNDILKYKYDEKMFLNTDKSVDKTLVGKDIDFVEEPENEYDSKAIAIYVDGEKLGYVYRGMIQDMLHDWLNKDFTICACISSVTNDEIRYIIGFYKPIETFNCDIFKLIKTSKKN